MLGVLFYISFPVFFSFSVCLFVILILLLSYFLLDSVTVFKNNSIVICFLVFKLCSFELIF